MKSPLTIANLPKDRAVELYSAYKLAAKQAPVNISFSIDTIAIYGADSTRNPEYQERLLTIDLLN